MLEPLILLPFFLLAFGAIVWTAAPRFSELARRWLSIGILALTVAALFANFATSSHRLELSTWDAAKFSLTLQLDGITLVLLLAILIPVLALQLTRPSASLDSFAYWVLLSAALVISSANLLTILFAWPLLDLALFAWRSARRIPHDEAMRALILGLLAGLGLAAGAILLDAKQSQTGALLLALAFWARLGLFPFHWLFPQEDLNTLELTAIRGAALGAGAGVWLRWGGLNANMPNELISLLASLALVAACVRIASSNEGVEKISANSALAIAFVPLAVAFGGEAAKALALAIALGVALGLAMFELGLTWQPDAQNRWARFFFVGGIFSLAGTPLTPAFLGRIGANIALIENGQGLIFFLGTIAASFALAPLWQINAELRGAQDREPTRSEYLGLQILGLAFIVYGFGATIVSQVTGNAAERALDLVVRTDDYPAAALSILSLLGSLVISFWLARVKWGHHVQGEEIAQLAERVMDLNWLARGLTRLGESASALGASLSALAEENPTIWILFAALWIAIFILTTR